MKINKTIRRNGPTKEDDMIVAAKLISEELKKQPVYFIAFLCR